jgi:KUP system potassium uptake protein
VQGGWFPLVIGALIFTVMSTWGRGREMMIVQAHARRARVRRR